MYSPLRPPGPGTYQQPTRKPLRRRRYHNHHHFYHHQSPEFPPTPTFTAITAIVTTTIAAVAPAAPAGQEMPKTEMPLIGILTIPDNDTFSNSSTIDASYVKYLDGAGAVTTPILFNATEDEIKEQFGYLNGVFFTRGRYTSPNALLHLSGHGVLIPSHHLLERPTELLPRQPATPTSCTHEHAEQAPTVQRTWPATLRRPRYCTTW